MRNDERVGSFLGKLYQWFGFLTDFCDLERSNGKLGETGKKEKRLKTQNATS